MSYSHDQKASFYGNLILKKIRESDSIFKQIFSSSIVRTGDWDWPRPDFVCYDEVLNATYALEFKPPNQSKREYLTGLGQSLSYLQKHNYSGLIVPYKADDGFEIANFICDTLNSYEFADIAISLYAYNPDDDSLDLLKPISKKRNEGMLRSVKNENKTFWCWWRDMSHYELYDLLKLSYEYADYEGDIYTDYIYPVFYDKMIKKQTKQWNGKPRNKNSSAASMKSEKQNYKIPLVQLDLWSQSEGRLTDDGFDLLTVGKKMGVNSDAFLNYLTALLLIKGKHLDLINMINNFQEVEDIPLLSRDYSLKLEEFLSNNGCIGKRKPSAVKTGAKNSYLRDEMKLWNKLGLLKNSESGSYFVKNKGYMFDWEKITKIILEYAKKVDM